MNKKKTLIILGALLLVLLLAYLVFVIVNSPDGEENPTYILADIDKDSLSEISYTYKEDSFTFHQVDGVWRLDSNPRLTFKENIIKGMITSFDPLKAWVSLGETNDEKLEEFGLKDPELSISMTDSVNGKKTYYIGLHNTFNSYYYFREQDSREVYMISSVVPIYFKYKLSDMVEGEIIPEFSLATTKKVSFSLPDGKELIYTHYAAGNKNEYTDAFSWYLSVDGGEEFAIDTELCRSFGAFLGTLKLSDVVTFDPSSTDYGLDSAVIMKVSYTAVKDEEDNAKSADEREFELIIGSTDDEGNYYVKSTESGVVYRLKADILKKIANSDIESKKPTTITSINEQLIDKLTIAGGGKSLFINITYDKGLSYSSNGEKIEYGDILELMNLLLTTPVANYAYLVEPDEHENNDILFSVDFRFLQGATDQDVLKITSYNKDYDLVSFRGESEMLILKSDTQKLIDELSRTLKTLNK